MVSYKVLSLAKAVEEAVIKARVREEAAEAAEAAAGEAAERRLAAEVRAEQASVATAISLLEKLGRLF